MITLESSASPSLQHDWRPLVNGLLGFWTAPVTPRPLVWFRIGLASVLLAQAASLAGHLHELFGRDGLVAWSVIFESQSAAVPSLLWIDQAFRFANLPTPLVVPLTFALYTAGLLSLLVGWRTRLAAGIAWLTHLALMSSGQLAAYGVDMFAQIGLFYCVCFPVGVRQTLDRPERDGNVNEIRDQPSFAAWLGLRVLQLHVVIIYTASGVEKACGEQWWNGEAIWRAVMGTPLKTPIDCSFLATVPWLVQGLCWLTLLLEAGVLFFVWHPRLRKLWLAGIVGMHLGIALLMGLWSFSAVMIVFDIAAFGITKDADFRLRNAVNCRLGQV